MLNICGWLVLRDLLQDVCLCMSTTSPVSHLNLYSTSVKPVCSFLLLPLCSSQRCTISNHLHTISVSAHSFPPSHVLSSICLFPTFQLGVQPICCNSAVVTMAALGLLLLLFEACALVFLKLCVCVVVFRKNVKASAVCRFSLPDVQRAFEGPYMESQNSDFKWKEYTGKIPDPRPGTVNTPMHRETATAALS